MRGVPSFLRPGDSQRAVRHGQLIGFCLEHGKDVLTSSQLARLPADVWPGTSPKQRSRLFEELIAEGLAQGPQTRQARRSLRTSHRLQIWARPALPSADQFPVCRRGPAREDISRHPDVHGRRPCMGRQQCVLQPTFVRSGQALGRRAKRGDETNRPRRSPGSPACAVQLPTPSPGGGCACRGCSQPRKGHGRPGGITAWKCGDLATQVPVQGWLVGSSIRLPRRYS